MTTSGRPSSPLRGAQWMMAAACCWAGLNYFIRIASEDMPPLEIAFFRCAFAVPLLVPLLAWRREPLWPRGRVGTILLVALTQTGASITWIMALAHIPIVEATALGFTSPFFGTVLAAMLLGERIRIRRVSALLVGFAGVLVVIDPTEVSFDPFALAALACALCAAAYGVQVRRLSAELHANTIVAYVFTFMTPITFGIALTAWTEPSLRSILALIAVAAIGTLGHLSMARAWAAAEIAVVAPFDYVQIVIAAAIGFFLLNESPALNVWAGAAIIIASAVYIARREAYLRRMREQNATDGP
ncbi:MAG: DMT family transporter [Alphaproteobacteria bacterium]